MPHDLLDHLQLAAGIIGMCAYVPMTVGIIRNTARQSFAAFFLWGLLDTIAMTSAILQDGNFWLAASNVAGATTIATLLLLKKQFEWSVTETLTCVLVAICLLTWYQAGNVGAIVASSLAVVLAGIPQMAHSWRNPRDTPVISYAMWLTANILSFLAGKAWTIEERFYAACSVVLCVSILAITWLAPTVRARAR